MKKTNEEIAEEIADVCRNGYEGHDVKGKVLEALNAKDRQLQELKFKFDQETWRHNPEPFDRIADLQQQLQVLKSDNQELRDILDGKDAQLQEARSEVERIKSNVIDLLAAGECTLHVNARCTKKK